MSVDPYYSQNEVSNSNLGELWDILHGKRDMDPTAAYAFGTLLDCMITEEHRVNYFKHTVEGEPYRYTKEDFKIAKKMKKAFFKDEMCVMLATNASFQAISVQHQFPITFGGFTFSLSTGVRCKWDLLVRSWKMGGDIKSTTSETLKQFESACSHFKYWRSRAWYMDIEGTDKDVLIGISKKNFKVFKIVLDKNAPIGTKARDYYEQGKREYQELSFEYWLMFDGFPIPKSFLNQLQIAS